MDSPVWAARLRLCSSSLIDTFDPRLGAVRECRIQVLPEPSPSIPLGVRPGIPEPSATARGANAIAAQHLLQASESIANQALGESLRRLARTLAGGPPDT